MTLKKFSLFMLVAVAIMVTIVACNSEVKDSNLNDAQVLFAPAVSKSLNQSGSTSTLSEDVNEYYWEYYCYPTDSSTVSTTPIKDLVGVNDTWSTFDNYAGTGLGTISGLTKNSCYYFGLKGYTYTTSTNGTEIVYTKDKLVWQGYHRVGDNAGDCQSVLLSSKKTSIRIDVNPVGTGNIYFNIEAPLVVDSGITYSTTATDRFVYSWSALGSNPIKSTDDDYKNVDRNLVSTYDSSIETFYYQSKAGENESLPAGNYFFTIWQETFNPDEDVNGYVAIEGRKQVVIVTVQSGVDTLISGSLDSTAGLVSTTFNAADQLNVIFVTPSDARVHEFKTKVYHADGSEIPSATMWNPDMDNGGVFFTLPVREGSYSIITWTTGTNTSDDVVLYVNGDKLLRNTTSDVAAANAAMTVAKNLNKISAADEDNYKIDSSDGLAENAYMYYQTTSGTDAKKYLLRITHDDDTDQDYLEHTWVRLPELVSGADNTTITDITTTYDTVLVEGTQKNDYILTLQYKKFDEANHATTESVSYSVQGGAILIESITLTPSVLTLSLNPAVTFPDTAQLTAWEENVGSTDSTLTTVYYEVDSAGSTDITGKTAIPASDFESMAANDPKKYYCAKTYVTNDETVYVLLPTEK